MSLVLAMVLLLFVRDLGPLIYIDRVLMGIGAGALFTGYFAWAGDIIPEERRTEGIALFGVSGLLPLALNLHPPPRQGPSSEPHQLGELWGRPNASQSPARL